MHFSLAQMKIIFFCLLRLQITCSPLLLNVLCRYVIFKHSWATKKSWQIFYKGPRKSLQSSGLFVSKKVRTLFYTSMCLLFSLAPALLLRQF